MQEQVNQIMVLYPLIYFACHTQHVRDPQTQKILSAHQASILDHLDDVEPTTLTDLAKHLGVTPSTMSIAVGRLLKQRYVVRERGKRDKRVVHLRLTPEGVALRESKSVLEPERVAEVLARLDENSRNEAIRGLTLLARASKEVMWSRSLQGSWNRKMESHSENTLAGGVERNTC